jgi:hypothetical protein
MRTVASVLGGIVFAMSLYYIILLYKNNRHKL